MKTSSLLVTILAATALSVGTGVRLSAQSAQSVNGQISRVAPANQAATENVSTAKLSYGLDDIVKLAKAKLDDSVILAFIKNSGTAYNPSAQDIVQLRQAGASAQVITALIQHGGELREAAAESQKRVQEEAEAAVVAQKVAVAQPNVVVKAPETAPVSTVTYIGYPRTYYAPVYSYGYCPPPVYYHPRYYPRYSLGYCAPRVSFGLSFGGRFHHGFRHCR